MSEQGQTYASQLTATQIFEVGSDFLNHFGVEVDPAENPTQFKDALQQLDPRYEGGLDLVRWQLEADQKTWDDPTKEVIMQTATSMRMLETETPLDGSLDLVIVLGGARQANLDRARYAAGAIAAGRITTRHLIVAGSSRVLPDTERDNAANYAPGAQTEFDLCAGAAAMVAREKPGLVAGVHFTENPKAGTPVIIENVLTSLLRNNNLPESARIAAVTTQIYQASTALDLERVARQFGAGETFAAGNPSDPKIVANRTPATYLSEVLRTLRAAVNVFEASNQSQTSPRPQTQANL